MINLNIFSTPCNISDSFSSESNCAAFALSAYEKLNIELILISQFVHDPKRKEVSYPYILWITHLHSHFI